MPKLNIQYETSEGGRGSTGGGNPGKREEGVYEKWVKKGKK